MTVRRANDREGDLLRTLTLAELSHAKAPRGGDPAVGSTVQLWRLAGDWKVWSHGPFAGTWWLNAEDETAHQLVEQIAAVRGAPVVLGVWKSSIAAKTKDIRPAAVTRGPR